MPTLELKPTHKAVVAYYASLADFARLGVAHESAVRSAFHELLEHCARQFDWKLVPEYRHQAQRPGRCQGRRRVARQLRPEPRPVGGQGFRRRPGKGDQKQIPGRLSQTEHSFLAARPRRALPERRALLRGRPGQARRTRPYPQTVSGIRAARHRGMGKSRRGIQGPRAPDRRQPQAAHRNRAPDQQKIHRRV